MTPEERPDARTVSQVGEFGLIRRVTEHRNQPSSTLLGPGDDAAVLTAPDGRVVATTDVLVQDVHFRLDWSGPRHVGRKAVAVNLSDIAAMGAVPTGLLVGLGCSGEVTAEFVDELAAGMWEEARRAGTALIGGDMVTSNQLTVSVTALGDLRGEKPVTREGARQGDVVALAGGLGWSAAGLAVLARGFRSPLSVVGAHRVPQPPYEAGPAAAVAGATSMIDVSDGLLADMAHVADASGVSVDIRTDQLEVPQRLLEVASALGADPGDWVLNGGEDQALVATFPGDRELPDGWRPIGRVRQGRGVTVDGVEHTERTGWQHWRH
ncbi:thiamine-phosphate kinase [Actinopolyspora alba]|uniref:Thiamine-monophosphate kinase n=1 Tax=Actinopolyspora alba TaxID=673379 RepID=A0A1I2B530_9ACTN|nr:thiamine-phosphate kinase [Actinopolyspora alba]SFE51159.1 thiamine-phosphate kinase [Actinopolyspora alba]